MSGSSAAEGTLPARWGRTASATWWLKIEPRAAIPVAMPTCRKVEFTPLAIPARSTGTTPTAVDANGGLISPIPTPATGWPLFGLLAVVYYVMNYFLLGAAFLGVGSQANSVREVQTLSLPITLVQLVVFALANAAVTKTTGAVGIAAAIFPLSSPLTMLGFAAQRGELWPHLLAIAWQALWVVVIIRLGAARFRSTVLKSGGAVPAPRKSRFGRVTSGSAVTN